MAPGPRMLLLMVLPLLIAVAVLLRHPRRLRHLLDLRLRAIPLLWAAVAVKLLQVSGAGWAGPFLRALHGLLPEVVIWALGVAFTLLNMRAVSRSARIALGAFTLGFTANTVAMVVNGAMPFSVATARAAGFSEAQLASAPDHYEPISDGTALALLADIIPVPLLQKVVSVGDLLMFAGLTAFVVALAASGRASATSGEMGAERVGATTPDDRDVPARS